MARKYDILNNGNTDWMFYDKFYFAKGYIAYRQVISHAMFVLMKNGLEKDVIKEYFDLFKINYSSSISSSAFGDGSFLRVYHLKEELGGVVLIDDTKGCFPLLINNERIIAFNQAIDNISNRIDDYLDVIFKHKNEQNIEWSQLIEKELDALDSRNNNPKYPVYNH